MRRPELADDTLELTTAQRQILKQQTISRDGPGAIARDFESLLGYLAKHEVPLTGVQQLPQIKHLPALNECLVHPLDIKLQRPEPDLSAPSEAAATEPEAPPLGEWQPLFQPYFPEWRHNLQLPELGVEAGVYIFKASLDKVWRRIAIPAEFFLEDLSDSILAAFDFDHDHLYAFRYRDRYGAMVEACHPFMDEGPYTTQVTLGKLPLRPGEAMQYVYDFGDNWRFKVELERIDPPDQKMKDWRLLESHGKAPEQYPSWGIDE